MIQDKIEEHWYAWSVDDTPTISIQGYVEEEGHEEKKMEIAQSIATPSASRIRAQRRNDLLLALIKEF
jgi:hypothetical protein